MAVHDVAERERRTYAGGRSFGTTGIAVLRRLRIGHRVDPVAPANATVVDLDLAPRDSDGFVAFDHDVVIVQPADPARRNGWAIVDVVNRGRATVPTYLMGDDTPPYPAPPEPPAGDGWLLELGWTIVYAGWQFDVVDPALLGLRAPLAHGPKGEELRGEVEYRLRPSSSSATLPLTSPGHRIWPLAPGSVPTLSADRVEVPSEHWRLDANGGVLRRTDDGRFDAGATHRYTYEATGAVVTGCGQLALRDLAGWLRSAEDVQHIVLFGASQSGRLIRQFLHDGCNVAEDGDRAYDVVLPVIAGGRLGHFNQRFAVPATLPDSPDEVPADATFGVLLARSDAAGASPKVVAINTSNEYWRGDAGLLHDDPHPEVRIHHVAGTQHVSGRVPQLFELPPFGWRGQHGFNVVDWRPVVRALLAQAVDWVEHGVVPAPSVVPTPAQLSDRATVLHTFARMGRAVPRVASFPQPEGRVPAIDEVGNELGGIRLPDVAAPIGVHTGWNVRHPATGAPQDEVLLMGSSWWFETLPDLDDHLTATRRVIDDLVARRFLLATDVDAVLAGARHRWEEARSARSA